MGDVAPCSIAPRRVTLVWLSSLLETAGTESVTCREAQTGMGDGAGPPGHCAQAKQSRHRPCVQNAFAGRVTQRHFECDGDAYHVKIIMTFERLMSASCVQSGPIVVGGFSGHHRAGRRPYGVLIIKRCQCSHPSSPLMRGFSPARQSLNQI
jgi:hypothetical protein